VVKQLFLLLFLSSLVTACGLSGSHAAIPPQRETYRLQPGQLVLAASEDDIPPVQAQEEHFVSAQDADLAGEELIVGLIIGGESRAYPVRLLSLHEVVNDRVGDLSFSVTWCPLCFSPVVYNRVVEGQELSFRASGYLLNDNLVLIDHPTDTLWSQLLGQGIKGAYRGTFLEIIPSSLTTWEIWSETHPDTLVLSAIKMGYEGEIPDPYRGYFNSGVSGLSGAEDIDQRLAGKALVYGLLFGESTAAVSLAELQQEVLITIDLGSVPVVGVYDPVSEQGFFYFAEVDGKVLTLEPLEGGMVIRDVESGTRWNSTTGVAIKGKLQGNQLQRYPAQLAFWFAWSQFYPQTVVLP
jgi:hypothetical protein